MRLRTLILGTVGVLATLFGLGLLFAPSLLHSGPVAALTTGITSTDPATLMFLAGVFIGLYLFRAIRSSRSSIRRPLGRDEFDLALQSPPETVTAERQALAAATVTGDVQTAIRVGEPYLESVQNLLQETATDAYVETANVPAAQARAAIEQGEWTDDGTAASFVAGEDGPDTPLAARLRLWLRPQAERRRRIDRTLTAIERLGTG